MALKKFNNPRAIGEEPPAVKRTGATVGRGWGRGRGRLEGMSNKEWAEELGRRRTVTADLKERGERKRAKEAEETMEARRAVASAAAERGKLCFPAPSHMFAPHGLYLPPGACGTQGSQASVASSSPLAF